VAKVDSLRHAAYNSAAQKIVDNNRWRWQSMVLLEFSVAPMGAGESVSAAVAKCLEIVERYGLDYQLHAMGTLVEGELDPIMSLLKECMQTVAAEYPRVTCTAKFDLRRGHSGRLQSKVSSVERQLGRHLKKTPGK
jgi:uncharacterized protein (TIGR00106 family)